MMKKLNRLISIVVTLLLSLSLSIVLKAQEGTYVPGKVRVKFTEEGISSFAQMKSTKTDDGVVLTGVAEVDELNMAYKTTSLKRVFPYSPKFEQRHRKHGLHLWYELNIDENVNPLTASKSYQDIENVTYAGAVPVVIHITSKPIEASNPVTTYATSSFNDPKLPLMWHYENDGTTIPGSTTDADINIFEAWETETGSSEVLVAIIDGGIDIDHEDLAATIWVNEGELGGIEGVDDDANGYVDDINGYNFAKSQGPIEAHYHGTHVAGIVGAISNNGIGIAGIAGGSGYNDGVKMMSCQIFTEDGANAGYAASLVYAADMGAVIAQNSWGWSEAGKFDPAVLEAIDYFITEAGQTAESPIQGGVVLFASGNNGADGEFYPGVYEPVIAVSALGANNTKAGYSNYGNWVDISVPGGDLALGTEAGIYSTLPADKYGYLVGTSMACPHASGIAALITSKFKGTGMTAEEVKTQLITSVQDVYPMNPDYLGKLGTGFVDAALALIQNNPLNNPSNVTDLEVMGVAQDFAEISWTMPTDPDNGQAAGFKVYWSTEPITSENFSYAASATIYEIFTKAGETINFKIDNLDATTTYYFGVVAFDRWNNESELSNVAEGTTNAGPEIRFEEDPILFTIDVSNDPFANGSGTLYNDAEGLMNWEVAARYSSHEVDLYSKDNYNYPVITNYHPLVSVGKDESIVISTEVCKAPVPMEWEESHKKYSGTASILIGDNDTSITNSAAIRYYVDDAEGFNLTNIRPYLKYDTATGPVIFEIYTGQELETAKLISVTEYNLSPGPGTREYQRDHKLRNPLFFERGSYFWVVYHVPAGNLYPIGISEEYEESGSDNNMMSFNGGETWLPLSVAIEDKEEKYAFACMIQSRQAPLDEFIIVSPTEGSVEGFGQQAIDISVDASNVIDGEYTHNLVFLSNDSKNKVYYSTILLDIDGHEPKLTSAKTVDFGSVFVGKEKSLQIQIYNEGYVGYKMGDNVVTSSNDTIFSIETGYGYQSQENIPARDEGFITITFAPQESGTFAEEITLLNGDGFEYSFFVYGVSSVPAILAITPVEDTVSGDLAIGEPIVDRTFNIKNDGDYPLQYKINKFDPDFSVEGLDKPANNFGYSYEAKLDISQEELVNEGFNAIESNDLWDVLKSYDMAVQVDLGFSFPYYGRIYDKVWIHEQGALVFGENGNVNLNFASGSSIDPNLIKDLDMITATMLHADFNSSNGGIYFSQEEGAFRVHYKYVKYNGTPEFQIVLHANGDVDILFAKTESNSNSDDYLIGLINRENDDVTLISNNEFPMERGLTSPYEKAAFKVKHPGEIMVSNVTNPSGVIMPGEDKNLTLSFNTSSVKQDFVYQRIPIISNDGYEPIKTHTVFANFVTGGYDSVIVPLDTLDFGTVYRTSVDSLALPLVNYGSATGTIDTVYFENDYYSYTRELPLHIAPRQTGYLELTINTGTAEELIDTVYVELSGGEVLKTVLYGNVIENPHITLDPVSISATLDARNSTETNLTITNSGNGTLDYELTPNYWIYPVEPALSEGESRDARYVYEQKNVSVFRDITDEQSALRFDYWYDKSWEEFYEVVVFPEPIEFYGQLYDTMWVGLAGWISFTKPRPTGMFLFPYGIPLAGDPVDNCIAPFAGNLKLYDIGEDQDHGVYVHYTEDELIVQWNSFLDLFGMSYQPFDFQLILNRHNGRIDFEYRNFFNSRAAGLIGVENKDGTEGTLAFYGNFPNDGKPISYSLYPVATKNVDPVSSETITMKIDATNLYDGIYRDTLEISNNSIESELVLLPVELTVTGQPELTVTSLDLDTIFYTPGLVVEKKVIIKNIGTKTASFNRAEQDGTKTSITFDYPGATSPVSYDSASIDIKDFIGNDVYTGTTPDVFIASGKTMAPGEKFELYFRFEPISLGAGSDTYRLIDIDGITILAEIPVSYTVILPPAMEIPEEAIVEYADDNTHQNTKTITLSNQDGDSPLYWNANILFNRGTNQIEEEVENYSVEPNTYFNELSSAPVPELMVESPGLHSIDPMISSDSIYNRILEYDTTTVPSNYLGYGTYTAFQSGTHFVAPADGFSLSHIKTWYRPESMLNGKIRVEILGGADNIANASIIGEGYLDYSVDDIDDYGEDFIIPLNEEIYIYPNEDFWVVIVYPLGVSNPQACHYVPYVEQITGRFFFRYDNQYYDLGLEQSYSQYGYKVKALEEEFNPKYWVALDKPSGTLEAGESVDLTFTFDANFASESVNNAQLVVTSNDPQKDSVNIDVQLLINKAPVVTKQIEGLISIKENETVTIEFEVSDEESDDFTFMILQNFSFTEITYLEKTIEITFSPSFDDQGVYPLSILATDEHGAKSLSLFQFKVEDVNRVPFAIPGGTITFNAQNDLFISDLTKFVDDYDNENLTYVYKVKNGENIEVLMSEYTLIVRPRELGTDTISITGTDAYGYSATSTIGFVVETTLDVDEKSVSDWSVYPNPAIDHVNVEFGTPSEEDSYLNVLNSIGQVVRSKDIPVNSSTILVPVENLEQGFYYIQVVSGAYSVLKPFIKE